MLYYKCIIDSYEVRNSSHGWNIVKIDDEYSYIDVTNLGGGLIPKSLAGILLDKFDLELGGYQVDPRTTGLTAMSDYDSKKIVIPTKLVEDIENGIDEKTLVERYGNTVGVRVIELLLLVIGIKLEIELFKKQKMRWIIDLKEELIVEAEDKNLTYKGK